MKFVLHALVVAGLCLQVTMMAGLWQPAIALASEDDDWTSGEPDTPAVPPVELQNPLKVDSLEELLIAVLNVFITILIPIIVFFIIFSGFKYVTAQGNPGKIEEATTSLLYAIIGGVLILAAVAIAEVLKNTIEAF